MQTPGRKRAAEYPVAPPLIEVGELQLRRATLGQSKLYSRVILDNVDHLSQWESWPREFSEALGHFMLASDEVLATRGRGAPYGIFEIDHLLGYVTMHSRRGNVAELGYWLTAEAEGKGVATRAARALVEVCFAQLGIQELRFRIMEGNHRSSNLAKRLGAELESTDPSKRQEIYILSKSSDLQK